MQQEWATVQFKESMGAIPGGFGTLVAGVCVPLHSSSHLLQPLRIFCVFFAVKSFLVNNLFENAKLIWNGDSGH